MLETIYPELKGNSIAREAILASMQFIQEERGQTITQTKEVIIVPSTDLFMVYGTTEDGGPKMTQEDLDEMYGGEPLISNTFTTFGKSIESLGLSQEEWDSLTQEEQDKIKECN